MVPGSKALHASRRIYQILESTHLNEQKYLRKKFLKQKKRRPRRMAEIKRENIKEQELTGISMFISVVFKRLTKRSRRKGFKGFAV